MSKGGKIGLWVVSILLAAMFLFAGSMKLLHPAETRSMFVHYGYAAWFATFIGVCEVLGGVGVLLPRLAILAAAGLSVIMLGAIYTHATHNELSHVPAPLVLLVLLIVAGFARVQELRRT